jgi:hypothetical protein
MPRFDFLVWFARGGTLTEVINAPGFLTRATDDWAWRLEPRELEYLQQRFGGFHSL